MNTVFWADFYASFGQVTFWRNQSFNNCRNHTPNENYAIDLYYKRHVQQQCEFASVYDADEYLLPTNSEYNIQSYKENLTEAFKKTFRESTATNDLIRLPWITMSSKGYHERPQGLIIEEYDIGDFIQPILRKDIFKTSLVNEHKSPHAPTQFVKTMRGRAIRQQDHHFTIQSHELRERQQMPSDCKEPISPFYLKHYMALSWADWNVTKGSRPLHSGGEKSYWTKEHWLSVGPVETKCKTLGSSFMILLTEKMKASIKHRLMQKSEFNNFTFHSWIHGHVISLQN